jgi:hypothetical protein
MEGSVSDCAGIDINETYLVHHSVCSLGKLAGRDRMPIKGRSLPGPLGDFRWFQPSVLVGVTKVHVGVGRLA